MDFGMPTLVELATTERNAALCAELGLQFVELNMNLPEYADVAGIDRALLRRLAEQYGIYFTLHLDERMDVCDFNPLVRAAYLETLRRALELAGELSMPILNLHFSSGVYFTLPESRVWLYERQSRAFEGALTPSARWWMRIARAAPASASKTPTAFRPLPGAASSAC